MNIKDWLIPSNQLTPEQYREYSRSLEPGSEGEIRFGHSDTFGVFKIMIKPDGSIHLISVERQMRMATMFMSVLSTEQVVFRYEKEVQAHKGHAKGDDTPRLYLDRHLQDAGFVPGTRVQITLNKVKKTILIEAI